MGSPLLWAGTAAKLLKKILRFTDDNGTDATITIDNSGFTINKTHATEGSVVVMSSTEQSGPHEASFSATSAQNNAIVNSKAQGVSTTTEIYGETGTDNETPYFGVFLANTAGSLTPVEMQLNNDGTSISNFTADDINMNAVDTLDLISGGTAGVTAATDLDLNSDTTTLTSTTEINLDAPTVNVNGAPVIGGGNTAYSARSDEFEIATAGYASGEWAQLTGNSVTLPAGKYIMWGWAGIPAPSGTGSITRLETVLSLANGDNTSSTPTVLSPDVGDNTVKQEQSTIDTFHNVYTTPIVKTFVAETTVYANIKVVFGAAGAARVATSIFAMKIA